MPPHVGVEGGTPSPRNESAASAMIAEAIANVPITSADCIRFGSRCFMMMRVCVAPNERAATMNSRSFSVSALARVTRQNGIQRCNVSAMMRIASPWPRKASTAIASKSGGNAHITSTSFWMMKSVVLPK